MVRKIRVTGKHAAGRLALVDDEDWARVRGWLWNYHRDHGAFTTTSTGRVTLHRFITGFARVEHINGNKLDNRRSNLVESNQRRAGAKRRKTTKLTSSQFKGVCWGTKAQRWIAGIQVDGVRHHLGVFEDERDAARAYDEAARRLLGDRARLNFPGERIRVVPTPSRRGRVRGERITNFGGGK